MYDGLVCYPDRSLQYRGAPTFTALGDGAGKTFFVIEELETVIVTNGDILRNTRVGKDIDHLIKNFLIPALEKSR